MFSAAKRFRNKIQKKRLLLDDCSARATRKLLCANSNAQCSKCPPPKRRYPSALETSAACRVKIFVHRSNRILQYRQRGFARATAIWESAPGGTVQRYSDCAKRRESRACDIFLQNERVLLRALLETMGPVASCSFRERDLNCKPSASLRLGTFRIYPAILV